MLSRVRPLGSWLAIPLACAAALVLAPPVLGHGGAYRGPGGVVPGVPGGPSSGGGGGGPGAKTGGGSPFTTTRKSTTPNYTDWGTWWEFNKDRFLNLRARLRSRTAVTGTQRSTDFSGRPDYEELKDRVVKLLGELANDRDADIADSSVLALGRITPAKNAGDARGAVVGALGHAEASVRQSAILALGVLGDAESVDLLVDLLRDGARGRSALGITQAVPDQARGLAAVALGLIGDAKAVEPLISAFRAGGSGSDEVRCAIVLALGLLRDAPHDATAFLISLLEDDRLSDRLLAQVPVALMRHGESARAAVPKLKKRLESKKSENLVRQSCAIALGRLAEPGETEIVEALLEAAESASDGGTSHFAFIALGELGGRAAAAGEAQAETRKQLVRALLRSVQRPKVKHHAPWAATAFALLGRELPKDGFERSEIEQRLTEAFKDANSLEAKSGIAIALGLMEAQSAGKLLLAEFEDCRDHDLSGALAEALGLMYYEPATKALRKRLAENSEPKVRARVAIALGLLGDLEVCGRLVKELEQIKSLYGTASVVKSLGIVGDRSAVDPLCDLATKKGHPALGRAFAAVALGLLGEKTPLPWNARVAENLNFLAAFAVQSEVLDIL